MRTIIAAVILLTGLISTPVFADFNEYKTGFKDGWETGWCDAKDRPLQSCTAPYAPYPSYPKYDRNNYNGGFADGYKKGQARAMK